MTSNLHLTKLNERAEQERLKLSSRRTKTRKKLHEEDSILSQNGFSNPIFYDDNNNQISNSFNDASITDNKRKKKKKKRNKDGDKDENAKTKKKSERSKKPPETFESLFNEISIAEEYEHSNIRVKKIDVQQNIELEAAEAGNDGNLSSSTLSDSNNNNNDAEPMNKPAKIVVDEEDLFNFDSSSESFDQVQKANDNKNNQLDNEDTISIMTMDRGGEGTVGILPNSDSIVQEAVQKSKKGIKNDDNDDPNEIISDPEDTDPETPFHFINGMSHITSIKQFVMSPAPFNHRDQSIRGRITRDKKNRTISGIKYYMHLEIPGTSNRFFILSAKKKKGTKSSYYIISTEPENSSSRSPNDEGIGKLRANTLGTRFVAYDNGFKPHTLDAMRNVKGVRKEMVMVCYETNILGFHGPRKMTLIIPGMDEDHNRVDCQPLTESDSISHRYNTSKEFNNNNKNSTRRNVTNQDTMDNLISLENKKPIWNDETQSFVLNFHGRVTMASVKNFQIVHQQDPNYIIMQFGRISEDCFTIDYKYPMSAYQAFAVALSSFDSKLACE